MINSAIKKVQSGRGFTLIELLIVIGIIAILAAIVIVAINPSRQFAQARNTQRESNVATILNAIGQNIADNKGVFSGCADASTISGSSTPIGAADKNIKGCLIPTYIPSEELPYDPEITTPAAGISNTGYTIKVDSVGRYTVCSPEHGTEASLEPIEPYCLTR